MSEKVSSVLQKLDQKEMSDAFLRNTLMDFLNEAQEQKRRELEEKQRLNDTSTHNPVLPRGLYQSSLIIRQTISYI